MLPLPVLDVSKVGILYRALALQIPEPITSGHSTGLIDEKVAKASNVGQVSLLLLP